MGKNAETTYWNETLLEEVTQKEATLSKTITQSDETITTEIISLQTNNIINREEFRGKEPVGTWIKKVNENIDTINYDFSLVYTESSCPKGILPDKLELYLFDEPGYGYIAPCIATGENNIPDYLHKRMFSHYPAICAQAENNFPPQRVVLEFSITKEGNVSGISIIESANELYDKEAFRLVRELKFSNPPFRNGEAQDICVRCPILFNPLLFCPKKL
ncbi:MAG: energy transducer TonB [Bacteroidales bacterium]|jgi:TonB family protein|nr:energy transducer TonB [Bacteroidales bacterium]